MRVRDLMRASPETCQADTDLAAATEKLWCRACGALPVLDAESKVIGIVTDRDICVALGTRDLRPSEATAADAMTSRVVTCHGDDEIHDALRLMREKKVRRLPAIDDAGKLIGLLCEPLPARAARSFAIDNRRFVMRRTN